MANKWRFDNSYKAVYIYSEKNKAYLFYSTYTQAKLNQKMSEKNKIKKMEEIEDRAYWNVLMNKKKKVIGENHIHATITKYPDNNLILGFTKEN